MPVFVCALCVFLVIDPEKRKGKRENIQRYEEIVTISTFHTLEQSKKDAKNFEITPITLSKH